MDRAQEQQRRPEFCVRLTSKASEEIIPAVERLLVPSPPLCSPCGSDLSPNRGAAKQRKRFHILSKISQTHLLLFKASKRPRQAHKRTFSYFSLSQLASAFLVFTRWRSVCYPCLAGVEMHKCGDPSLLTFVHFYYSRTVQPGPVCLYVRGHIYLTWASKMGLSSGLRWGNKAL
jgi:hypothetical protein